MSIGVIVFPDFDSGKGLIQSLRMISSYEIRTVETDCNNLSEYRMIFLSGGARWLELLKQKHLSSPIFEALFNYAENNGIIVGTGEGFNLLCHLKLLPGSFEQNKSGCFVSRNVFLKANNSHSAFTNQIFKSKPLKIPLSGLYGKYVASEKELTYMRQNNQIAFHYCDENSKVSDKINHTGSVDNIAAIISETGKILGISPNPEFAVNPLLGNDDGILIFTSIFRWFGGLIK
jgi:phosphoribosylformylglycinamidine synthase